MNCQCESCLYGNESPPESLCADCHHALVDCVCTPPNLFYAPPTPYYGPSAEQRTYLEGLDDCPF